MGAFFIDRFSAPSRTPCTACCFLFMEFTEAIAPGKVVELKYTLREGGPDGPVLEIMDEQWPLRFLFGAGTMLPVFEENLSPLRSGQRFAFRIAAADAYGAHHSDQVVQIFRDELVEDHRYPFENYAVGDFVQLNTQSGKPLAGKLKQVDAAYVVVDCNHAMAGKDLFFEGQILFVREATSDEKAAGRYIEL